MQYCSTKTMISFSVLAQGIKDRIQNNGDAYCKCNFRQGCKAACPTTPAECRLPPTDHCTGECMVIIGRCCFICVTVCEHEYMTSTYRVFFFTPVVSTESVLQ